jgi:hypothetical protein
MSTFYVKNTYIYIRDVPEDDLCGSKIVAKNATINSTSYGMINERIRN